MTIIVSEEETGTNADILAGTLLENIPEDGTLTLEMQASDCIAANHYVATLQVGDIVPMTGVLIPGAPTAGLTGTLNDLTKLMITLIVTKGDKVLFSTVETGDAEFMWRATFNPLRR